MIRVQASVQWESGDHLQHRFFRGSKLCRSAEGGLFSCLAVPYFLKRPAPPVGLNRDELAWCMRCRVTRASIHAGSDWPSVRETTGSVCAKVSCDAHTATRPQRYCPHLCPLSASGPTVVWPWGQRVDLIALGSPFRSPSSSESCTAKSTPQVASLTA